MTDTVLPCEKRSRKTVSKRVRFEVFKRDGFACQYCGTALSLDLKSHPLIPDCLVQAGVWPTADHIVPISRGGTDDFENLVAACAPCNSQKRSMTGDEYVAWRKVRGL